MNTLMSSGVLLRVDYNTRSGEGADLGQAVVPVHLDLRRDPVLHVIYRYSTRLARSDSSGMYS